ncbi:MAG: hypothetical protein AB7F89_19130 [Pirellulaceae bacterium]
MIDNLRFAMAVGLVGVLCQAESPCHAESPVPAPREWLLMVDDHWIESHENVRRVLQQPVKHPGNPLIHGDQPWARHPYCYGTVLYDKPTSKFQLWYMSYNQGYPLQDRTPVLYATSGDGVAWQRPPLGLFEFRGSRENNIVLSHYGHHDLYSPSVVRDDRELDPRRRYKMVWWDFPKGPQGYQDDGMCVGFSPDGIHWEKYAGNPVLPALQRERSISDVMSVMYDSRAEKFVVYAKGWAEPWPAFRQIVRTESTDFVHWTEPEVVLRHAFNEQDPQSYGMVVSQYESVYLGLLCSYKKPGNETIDIQLAISHDNRNWARVADQTTFLPLGPAGSWDDGMLFCAPLLVHGDEVRLYYGGWDGPHNTKARSAGIGLATLAKDRFVSLQATANPGIVTTRLFAPVDARRRLHVNAHAEGGSVRAAVLDESGEPIAGYRAEDCIPLRADGLHQTVAWQGGNELPRGRALRFRFVLDSAALYALCLEP